MKISDLKSEIKNYIYEILSEDEAYELTEATGNKTVASFKTQGEANKFKQQNVNVKQVKKLEEESESDNKKENIPTIADFKKLNIFQGIKMNIGGKEYKLSRYSDNDGVSYHAHRKEDDQMYDFNNYAELKKFIKTGITDVKPRDVSKYDYETSQPKKYITEILSEEVNEDLYREKPSSQKSDPQGKNPNLVTLNPNTNPEDKKTINDPGFKAKYEKVQEETLDEARPSSALIIGDIEKANAVKDQYKGKWLEKMIDIIIDAGEAGIGQSAVAAQLGKVQQAINPQVRALTAAGVFSTVGGAPAPSTPKEKIAKEKPVKVKPAKDEEETDVEDTYYKADAEDVGFDDEKEPSKKDIEKEKIATPSKFKIPQDKFEDFKLKLKNLVNKIKEMPKGDEKDRKMAALKQFIKNPELVKAFKERDVTIDTGDLVG